MIFLPLETELFYYEHLFDSADNLNLIQDFYVSNSSGTGLERYIKELSESKELMPAWQKKRSANFKYSNPIGDKWRTAVIPLYV